MSGGTIEFELPVWENKARELALALRDPNPLWLDPAAAAAAGLPANPAPPTFPVMQAWRVSVEELQAIGPRIDYARALHAGQAFAYERPLRVGEVLHGRCECQGVTRREGRSGAMSFVTYRTAYADAAGAPVATSDYTLVEFEASRPDTGAQQTWTGPEPPAAERVREIEPIGRVDLSRYAGASGDFHPMHIDEAAALAAGEPSVFAAGMLIAGLVGAVATEWCGTPTLGRFSVRILNRVWPGDELRCEAEPAREDGTVALRMRRRGASGVWQTAIAAEAAGTS
ncbi:MAG: MaoC family dehydratase N-terminal domain-containing protein [Solirubrobacterales bacterium]